MVQRDIAEVSGNVETVLEAQEGQRVSLSNMKLNASAIRDQIKNANIQAMYKNIKKTKRRAAANVSNAEEQHIEPEDRVAKWTYTRLVDCGPIAEYVNRVLFEIRKSIPKFFQQAKHACHFEFLICIDNSGSMGSKEQAVHEALVVLIEVIRKLEFRFAIALWGRHKNEKLMLGFDDVFNAKKGQEIIESLTFDESSEMADCIGSLVNKVWPSKAAPSTLNASSSTSPTASLTMRSTKTSPPSSPSTTSSSGWCSSATRAIPRTRISSWGCASRAAGPSWRRCMSERGRYSSLRSSPS